MRDEIKRSVNLWVSPNFVNTAVDDILQVCTTYAQRQKILNEVQIQTTAQPKKM
jgi:hypothetical protein